MGRLKARMLILAALSIGGAAEMLFALFLFVGSFTLIDLGLERPQALAADALLSLLFFAQHSTMVRKDFRKRLSRLVPDDYYGAFYAVSSGAVLIVALLLWQRIPGPVAKADGLLHWGLRALFFLSIAGFSWGVRSLDSFDVFGVERIRRLLRNRETRDMPMTVRGAYRWVRHPLYLFSLVMIWSCPELTLDRLLFDIVWTAWIFLATVLEERDLVADFGDGYREYQAKVPMIIPWKIPARDRTARH